MKNLCIAILGATGAVGTEMLNALNERDIPCDSLRLLAAPVEAGKKILFRGRELTVEGASENSFQGVDVLLVAAANEISERFSPLAVQQGAIVIDNSSAYRLDPKVPLVVPEVNPQDIETHSGIIANPNCSTIIAMVAVNPLYRRHRVRRMTVSTYQAVSGAGIRGLQELERQVAAYLRGEVLEHETFQHQIAFNVIPHIESFLENGYTKEEMKMHNEGRKILHDDQLIVTCTCARVPVFRSHSEAIQLMFDEEVDVEETRELLRTAPGVKLMDDPAHNVYPMPVDTSNQDLVYVGRIRRDLADRHMLNLWCCGDQIRKGAAVNAIQITQLVIQKYFA